MGGHPNFLTLIGEEPGRCLQTAETYAITDRVCVLADASTETPKCLADKHTYEDLTSWLDSCHENTAEDRESVQLWLRDTTTKRGGVMVRIEPPCVDPEPPRRGLVRALMEAYDQQMVIEYQWHWPYCLWLKTKAGHLAELNRGVVQLNALKTCFASLTEELQQAEKALDRTELQIMQMLDTLISPEPGTESAKHRAIAQKYDLKTSRELVVQRVGWNRAQCSLDRGHLWKQVLTRKDLAPSMNGNDIHFLSREELVLYMPQLTSLYNEERESEINKETEALQFWYVIKMVDAPVRGPKVRRTDQSSAPAENKSAEQPVIDSGNGAPHYVCYCRPSSGCFCHLTAFKNKAKEQNNHESNHESSAPAEDTPAEQPVVAAYYMQ